MSKSAVLNEAVHNGMVLKLTMDVQDCPDIEAYTGTFIKIVMANSVSLLGTLKKVSTVLIKEKGEVIGVGKQITLLVDTISTTEATVVSFPDNKAEYIETVEVTYLPNSENNTDGE